MSIRVRRAFLEIAVTSQSALRKYPPAFRHLKLSRKRDGLGQIALCQRVKTGLESAIECPHEF